MTHPKGELIERCRHLGLGKPTFNTKSTGPAHDPTFVTDVVVGGEVYGTGQGNTKRDAERRASEEALAYLQANATSDTAPDDDGADEIETLEPAERPQGRSRREDRRPDARAERRNERSGPTTQSPHDDRDDADEPFDGPWPLEPSVLTACLEIANARVEGHIRGTEAIHAVRDLALALYKDTLANLGEVIDVDDA